MWCSSLHGCIARVAGQRPADTQVARDSVMTRLAGLGGSRFAGHRPADVQTVQGRVERHDWLGQWQPLRYCHLLPSTTSNPNHCVPVPCAGAPARQGSNLSGLAAAACGAARSARALGGGRAPHLRQRPSAALGAAAMARAAGVYRGGVPGQGHGLEALLKKWALTRPL